MRGKVILSFDPLPRKGITPAYAGKRIVLPWIWIVLGDHPRVCGEKVAHPLYHTRKGGSPPRMRGKAEPEAAPRPALRITPAYAGKSRRVFYTKTCIRDHPRVCGEKTVTTRGASRHLGSPPRMRGKVRMTLVDLVRTGITPAYAGKRGWMRATEVTRKDHPRVCGEKAYSLVINGSEWGSPPRMRGKACTCSCASIAGRITPAYAGKRADGARLRAAMGDHPRVCGEKTKKIP